MIQYEVLDKHGNSHGKFEDKGIALELADGMNAQHPEEGYYVKPNDAAVSAELLKVEVDDAKENALLELEALKENIEKMYNLRIPTKNFKHVLVKTGNIINSLNALVWTKPFS